jgi:hypothetical protein
MVMLTPAMPVFENVAHGHQDTRFAPALKYSPDSVVTLPEGLTTAPESTTTAPPKSETTTTSSSGSTTTIEKATAHPAGGVKFSKGKLLATVACGGTDGTCHVILEISAGKAGMEVPLTVAAGKKETIKVKPSTALAKAIAAHPKAKLSVRLLAPEGRPRRSRSASRAGDKKCEKGPPVAGPLFAFLSANCGRPADQHNAGRWERSPRRASASCVTTFNRMRIY